MSKIVKKMKIMQPDGTLSDYVSIGAEAENINVDGESVETKLGKKPYYYNTVADMKTDTKLKAGDMAVTLGYYEPNDGGNGEYRIRKKISSDIIDTMLTIELTTDNTLIAELIENNINLLTLGGKKNNNTFDNSIIINSYINRLNSYNYLKIPTGIFYTLNPININKPLTKIKCDGDINYLGNNCAININSNANTFDIYSINSNSKGIKIESTNNRIFNQEININKLYSKDNCFYFNAINPIFQINIKCFECGSVTDGTRQSNFLFTIPSTAVNSYLNEINILDSIIFNNTKAYGIKAVNDSLTSEIQYNVSGGSLENTTGVYSSGKITAVTFNHVRLHEFFDRTFLKLIGEVGRYAFRGVVPLHSTFIDWSEANESIGRIFADCGFRDKINGYTHVGECILSNQCVIPQHFYSRVKTLTGLNVEINNVYTQGLANNFEINTNDGETTIKLDGHVYSGAFINEITLLNYGDNAHVITIVDQNNNQLARFPKGRYLIKFGGTYNNPTIDFIFNDRRNA